MRFTKQATVDVKINLRMEMRERGKLVERRDGHNIWLDLGREYLAQLIAYQSMTPLTPYRNDRIRYIGLGIGGTRQIAPTIVSQPPLSTDYPGTNNQTDQDPEVTRLERPVRVTGSSTPFPYNANDVWLGQVQAPPEFPASNKVTFKRTFGNLEVSYPPYQVVPLSEVGLFTSNANPRVPNSTMVAYDTFETLAKTDAFELEIAWTIIF